MKKLLVILALSISALAQTTNLGMNTPADGTTNWGALLNNNFTKIDAWVVGDGIVIGTSATTTTLSGYLATPAANTTLIVASNQTLSTRPTVGVNNLRIKCENGAVITVSANMGIQFTGNSDVIEGCTFTGPGTGVSTVPLITTSGNNFAFRKNTVSGFGSTGALGVIEATNGNLGEVSDNYITGNTEASFFLNATTAAFSVLGWRVERNLAQNIVVHDTAATSTVQFVTIVGNDLSPGSNSNIEYCVEVGNFGGSNPTNATITGNTCHLGVNGSNGGIGLVSVNTFAITGNTIDDQTFTDTVAGINVVDSNDGTISGNTLRLQNTANTLAISITASASTPSGITVTGNQISGFGTSTTSAGIFVGSSVAAKTIKNIVISGNDIKFTAASAGRGIWVLSNGAAAAASNIHINGNQINSDGTASSIGIRLENANGTIAGSTVDLNTMSNAPASLYSIVNTVTATIEDRNGIAFANLPAAAAGQNGSVIYVSDGTIANPCAAGGTGSIAKYLNAVRVCN